MKYLLYLPVILISYAIGSVSMAHFLSGRKGFDIREKGSGNMGASNAMITMGWGAGVITALFDMAKAALCVFAADRLLGETLPCVGAAAGVAAIIGHISSLNAITAVKIPRETIPERASGAITKRNRCPILHPSMAAASSRSLGSA